MDLLSLIVAIAAVGILLFCINKFVPMEGSVKKILNIVVILVLVVWCLEAFGVIDALRGLQIPKASGHR